MRSFLRTGVCSDAKSGFDFQPFLSALLCGHRFAGSALSFFSVSSAPGQDSKTKDEKKEEKKPDAFKVQKITQGMGLYAIGPVSPDRKSVLLLAHKPDAAPNLYIMNIGDHSIRPPLTNLKWGVAGPRWSPDGQSIAFAGFSETATFDEIFILDFRSGKMRQLTRNAFSDKEPVFTPDGKRLLIHIR